MLFSLCRTGPIRDCQISHTGKAEKAPLAAENCGRRNFIEAETTEHLQEVSGYVTGFSEFQNG